MTEQVDKHVFGPCRKEDHDQCMVQFRRADGTVAMRCICPCGHKAQQERDPSEGVPA